MSIEALVKKQRDFFESGRTIPLAYRLKALDMLEQSILDYEEMLVQSLKEDLGKSREEAYMCEIGLTLSELRYMKKHLTSFAKSRRVHTPVAQFPSKSFTVQEPYGVTLVMSPWNYPVLLTLEPLIGALAAGNCCVIKPSAYAPATSNVLKKMLSCSFESGYVAVVEGGRMENQSLLEQRFDYIFFTGGVNVGRMVMEKAAVHLTPVFSGKLGEKIAADCVTAIDDGTIPNEWGSSNMDDEGNPTQKNVLIEKGILKSYMVDMKNGRRMNALPTGSTRRQSYRYSPTSRMTNTYIANGESTMEEIIANTKFGLFAKTMAGGSVSPATGEYNFSVGEAFMIEDGKLTKRVKGATLIGNGKDTLLKIDMVANNQSFGYGMCGASSGSIPACVGQPTIRVKNMTVGGNGGNK